MILLSRIFSITRKKQVVHVTDRAAAYTLLRDIHGYLSGSGFPTKDEKKNGIRVIPLCGGETWEIGWLSKVNIAENEMTPGIPSISDRSLCCG